MNPTPLVFFALLLFHRWGSIPPYAQTLALRSARRKCLPPRLTVAVCLPTSDHREHESISKGMCLTTGIRPYARCHAGDNGPGYIPGTM